MEGNLGSLLMVQFLVYLVAFVEKAAHCPSVSVQ